MVWLAVIFICGKIKLQKHSSDSSLLGNGQTKSKIKYCTFQTYSFNYVAVTLHRQMMYRPYSLHGAVLLEQLTGLQLVKKFPAFHGTRRFITALTSVRYLSLSWASPIQSTHPHPTSWRSILILSTHLRLGLPSGLFPSSFPTKTL